MEEPGHFLDLLAGNAEFQNREGEHMIDLENFDDIDINEDEGNRNLGEINEEEMRGEIIFCIQGVGSVKNIDNMDVYIKGQFCEEALRDLHKYIRRDNPELCLIRSELAQWNFLLKDLLPLLVSQANDKKLSFHAIILLVDLTEPVFSGCKVKNDMILALQMYKLAFLAPSVIKCIITHMADCLEKDQQSRNEKHDQMIELIVVLFKHLLAIPDPPKSTTNLAYQDLQKKLLTLYYDSNVLDSFIYLTQEFNTTLSKKLALHFLEIFYHIYKYFNPSQLILKEGTEKTKSNLSILREKEQQENSKRWREMSSRHSRFGTSLRVKRPFEGTSMIITNVFKPIPDPNIIPKQRQKPKVRKVNQRGNLVTAPLAIENDELLYEGKDDKEFMTNLYKFSVDFMENSYSPLMEEIYTQLYANSYYIYIYIYIYIVTDLKTMIPNIFYVSQLL